MAKRCRAFPVRALGVKRIRTAQRFGGRVGVHDSVLVGLLMSLTGLALLYARETPVRVGGVLLAVSRVVFVFASPADPTASIILLVLVALAASMIFGRQWFKRGKEPRDVNSAEPAAAADRPRCAE